MEYELTLEDKKWNKLWDLWADGKIESPYAEIMEYSSQVNNGGHAQFFSNLGDLKELDKVMNVLFNNLPKIFVEKVKEAYASYLKDEFSDETESLNDQCDTIFFANEKLINDILQKYANTLEL